MGRTAQGPVVSGIKTAGNTAQAGGVLGVLSYFTVPLPLAGAAALLWSYAVGILAPFARDQLDTTPKPQGWKLLGYRFLSGLGAVVLAVGLSACTVQLGHEGEWFKGGLADGFCLEAHILDQGGSFGHCGEDEEPGEPE